MQQNLRISHLPSLRLWHVQIETFRRAPKLSVQYTKLQRRSVCACSYREHKELLSKLDTMSEDELEAWIASNREQLTISFLGWIAEEEAAASGPEQERLWDIGSRLMALREGLTPVTAAQLSKELESASAAAAGTQSNASEASPAALSVTGSGLPAAVRQNAALGLSVEGMELLEQQAAALEATMGTRRAQALTEIIGRKRMTVPQEANKLINADTAGRILEVLVQIESREDRAEMLPEAFTPPSYSSEEIEQDQDEEELYTTPLQLLQAVDLWLRRLEGNESGSSGRAKSASRLLGGAGLGFDTERLVVVLQELREDVLGHWDVSSGEDF